MKRRNWFLSVFASAGTLVAGTAEAGIFGRRRRNRCQPVTCCVDADNSIEALSRLTINDENASEDPCIATFRVITAQNELAPHEVGEVVTLFATMTGGSELVVGEMAPCTGPASPTQGLTYHYYCLSLESLVAGEYRFRAEAVYHRKREVGDSTIPHQIDCGTMPEP